MPHTRASTLEERLSREAGFKTPTDRALTRAWKNEWTLYGLDDDTFMEKHVKPLLYASETKAGLHEGKWRYSKPLAALSTRMQAARLIAEMKGLVLKKQESKASQVRVIIINQAHRPPRAPIAPQSL